MFHDHDHDHDYDLGHDQHNWWLGGGTTALIALIPLFIIAFLLYSGWTRLKQVSMAIAIIMAMAMVLAIEMVNKVNLIGKLLLCSGWSRFKQVTMATAMAIIMAKAIKMAKANPSRSSCFQPLSRDSNHGQ